MRITTRRLYRSMLGRQPLLRRESLGVADTASAEGMMHQ